MGAVGFSFAGRYDRMGIVDDYNMKKYIILLLTGVGIISTGVAIGAAMWITRKKPVSVEIIGGADEPTSIFLAGKIGRKKKRR